VLVKLYLEKGLYAYSAASVCKVLQRLKSEPVDVLPNDGGVMHISTDTIDFVYEVCSERIDDLEAADIGGGGSLEGNELRVQITSLEKELGGYYKLVKNREDGIASMRALRR